ncbi:MAG: tetratricopeptide repeat protein [Candidatus Acidiferrales bacterium]
MQDSPNKQPDTTRPVVPLIKTADLSREEEFALGEAYFLAFMPDEATAIFEKFLSGRDRYSRIAWQRHLQMVFAAYDRHDDAEKLLAEYRQTFPPIAEDTSYTYQAVWNQARRYRDAGNHAKAVELILEDVNALPTDVPFSSFRLLIAYLPSFEAIGKGDEALQKVEGVIRDLKAMLVKNNQPLPTGQRPQIPRTRHAHKPGVIHNVSGYHLADDAPDFDAQKLRFRISMGMIGSLEYSLEKARSAGTAAAQP